MRIKTLTRVNKRSPFGWCIDENSNEVPDKREQNMILIVRGYRLNRLSYSAIAEKFTTAGYMTRTGKAKFNKSMIKRINDAETVDERNDRLNRESQQAPLGCQWVDGELVKHEGEYKVIERMRKLRDLGVTYKEIVRTLNQMSKTKIDTLDDAIFVESN